jgi:acyl carrier protein
MPAESRLPGRTLPARARILEEVTQIVAEFTDLAVDEIRPKHRLIVDLALDSLDRVELIMEVEEHFDVSVPDALADKAETVGDVADGVLGLLGG